MRHLGDITKICGYDAPVVDVVIGGSPCQDLSVAGKRAGLAGERSGLYMEQIRIIKEMRENDRLHGRSGHLVRPRFMVWENVPGAFSSNGGKDFAAVIEEAIHVADPEAPPVPVPEKGWPTSGVYADERGRWSVAWRVLDAQFWGVPQRRRRIVLVADFGGLAAPEILFVREGVSGHFEPGEPQRKEAAGDAGEGAGGASYAAQGSIDRRVMEPILLESNQNHATVQTNGICTTLPASMGMGGGYVPMITELVTFEQPVYGIDQQGGKGGANFSVGVMPPLLSDSHGTPHAVVYAVDQGGGESGANVTKNTAPTLCTTHGGEPAVAYSIENPLREVVGINGDIAGTLDANYFKGCGERQGTEREVVFVKHTVRRLTPLECERLQGFPDGWTDIGEWVDSKGKKHKEADTPRYKALGNSIALPPWKWVCKRLCACYERDATMASLFDGIGGFPLIWEQLNGKGSCLWASEIEEFPIAVTKLRFGGEVDGRKEVLLAEAEA